MPPKSEMNIVRPHFWSWTKVTNKKCSYGHDFLKSNSIFIFDLDMFELVEFFGFAPFISVPNPGLIGLKMVWIEGNFG